jgi:hypothetical protein
MEASHFVVVGEGSDSVKLTANELESLTACAREEWQLACCQLPATAMGEGGNDTGHKPLKNKKFEAGCASLSLSDTRAGDGARTHDSHVGNVALYH